MEMDSGFPVMLENQYETEIHHFYIFGRHESYDFTKKRMKIVAFEIYYGLTKKKKIENKEEIGLRFGNTNFVINYNFSTTGNPLHILLGVP